MFLAVCRFIKEVLYRRSMELEGLTDVVLDYWGNARRRIGLSRLSVVLVLSQVTVVKSIDVRIE